MIELDASFTLADLANVKKVSFDPLYNKNRASSWNGHMYITPDKMYYLVDPATMEGKTVWVKKVLYFEDS